MTLAEWINFNIKNGLYNAGNDIVVVGQKDGSYSTNDNIFEMKTKQLYARELFGHYDMMFFQPSIRNEYPVIRVLINIPTPEEMKRK